MGGRFGGCLHVEREAPQERLGEVSRSASRRGLRGQRIDTFHTPKKLSGGADERRSPDTERPSSTPLSDRGDRMCEVDRNVGLDGISLECIGHAWKRCEIIMK